MIHYEYGTPSYLPPEALLGVHSCASDMWGLGASLFEAVAGEPPFGAIGDDESRCDFAKRIQAATVDCSKLKKYGAAFVKFMLVRLYHSITAARSWKCACRRFEAWQ